jgi:dipeptidyl aminopeptidase/acylaminoacyl peptidase
LAFVSATSLQLAAASDDLAAKRGITPEDYLTFECAGDPHLSPDGKVVAYVLTTIDQKKNRRQSSVWLVPVDGSSRPRRLSAEGFDSNTPRWSPSGKTLAYLSSRNLDASAGDPPRPQIYLLPTAGGEGLALTKFKNGVQAYQWSPDETRIAAVSLSGPSDAVAPADRTSDVRHYMHSRYKFNDTGWFDDKRRHLWVVDGIRCPTCRGRAAARRGISRARAVPRTHRWWCRRGGPMPRPAAPCAVLRLIPAPLRASL